MNLNTNKSKYTTKYPYAIGIDLGTSNSCVAVKIGNEIKVIEAKEGVSKQGKTLASCVSFTENEILVGDIAKNRLVIAPNETVYQSKRQMGTDHKWTIHNKQYRPEQIGAIIVNKLKADVEAFVEAQITEVVVTVPAQFDDLQRKATADAMKIAGLTCLRLINEPTAAALAFNFTDLKNSQKIIVADLGGGTFDVSILNCEQSVFSVIATGGDTKLGGKDIDDTMIKYTIEQIKNNYNYDVKNNNDALEKVRSAVEETKIALSSMLNTNLIIPFLGLNQKNEPITVNIPYSRLILEQQIKTILEKVKNSIYNTIKDAGINKGEISKLLLVGGPMNMPSLVTVIQQSVGIKASTSLNPNNCVAIGAAKQAATLSTHVDAVNDSSSEILLLDVTPLSLGLATEGNIFSKVIEKNSHVPIKKSMKYTTATDNQDGVDIQILQGERHIASENKELNTFRLTGIPKMKRGEPIIEVTFEIDASGVLTVSAEESTTKVKQTVNVVHNKNLSSEEIDRMIKDAEENNAKDEAYKKKTEIIQNAKSTVYSLEDAKANEKLNISEENKVKIDTLVSEYNEMIKDAENKEDLSELEQKIKETQTFMMELFQNKMPENNNEASDTQSSNNEASDTEPVKPD